jgi:transcriptional regulator with XRE-family HTH domain
MIESFREKVVMKVPEFTLDPKEIGNRIKRRREELDLSAEYVMEKCGITRSTYYRIEAGDGKTMKTEKIRTIAEFLRMDALMIAGIEKEPADSEDELLEIINSLDETEKRLLKRIHQLPPEQKKSLEVLLQGPTQSAQAGQGQSGEDDG